MKVLITGCNGFVGRHATAVLRARGHDVSGVDLQPAPTLDLPYHTLDICDATAVEQTLAELRPDAVLHLGGIAFVPIAWENPQLVFHVNTIGPLNLLSAIRRVVPAARMLLVTSAEVYGSRATPAPLTEDAPYLPDTLYGVTKAAADHASLLYATRHHLDLMVARPSNHLGVGQNPSFVSSAFASQLAAIANGAEPVIRTGNLDQERDFTDVRDVVRAYALLLENGLSLTPYNIASGHMTRIRDLLETLCDISRIHPRIETDPALFRPTDRHPAYDTSRLRTRTGWCPEIPLRDTLAALYASLHSPSPKA